MRSQITLCHIIVPMVSGLLFSAGMIGVHPAHRVPLGRVILPALVQFLFDERSATKFLRLILMPTTQVIIMRNAKTVCKIWPYIFHTQRLGRIEYVYQLRKTGQIPCAENASEVLAQ